MKAKAELIQASNNLATGVPIYTFLLTYQVKHWLLDSLGLSRFAFVAKHLTTRYYITGTNISVILNQARAEANRGVYFALKDRMRDVQDLTDGIFLSVNPNGVAKRISSVQMKKAMDLFGARLQDVLKQYKPGEVHSPVGMGAEHIFVALHKADDKFDGWLRKFLIA